MKRLIWSAGSLSWEFCAQRVRLSVAVVLLGSAALAEDGVPADRDIEAHGRIGCGPSCLYVASRVLGLTPDLQTLVDACNIGGTGISTMRSLAGAAREMGLDAHAVTLAPEDLQPLLGRGGDCCVIAHTGGTHFIVVLGITDRRVLIADPPSGPGWQSRADFDSAWQGKALVLRNPSDWTSGSVLLWFGLTAAAAGIVLLSWGRTHAR